MQRSIEAKFVFMHRGEFGCGKPAFYLSQRLGPFEALPYSMITHLDGTLAVKGEQLRCGSCGEQRGDLNSEYIEEMEQDG